MNEQPTQDQPPETEPPVETQGQKTSKRRGAGRLYSVTALAAVAGLTAGLATAFSDSFAIALLCLIPLVGFVQSPTSLILKHSRPFVAAVLAGILFMAGVRGLIIPRPPDKQGLAPPAALGEPAAPRRGAGPLAPGPPPG